MAFNRPLTNIEKSIDFNLYERFLDTVKDQSIRELREIVNEQKNAYALTVKNILQTNERASKQINEIDALKIKYYQPFYNVIKEYLNIICLFGLKQTTQELKIKNPKKLSMEMVSWINATCNTVTNKYLNNTNLIVTLPIIDNIGRGLSDIELVYRINLLFDEIIIKQPAIIIGSLEGKALFRGRDLAVRLFNNDIKLEAEGFLAATEEFFKRERVVAAQWSAILDSHTCPLCAQLDGHIVDIDSPDYAFYNPGSLHIGCRCMWIYIRSSERPENRVVDWKKPDPKLMKKYSTPDALHSLGTDTQVLQDVQLSKEEAKNVIKEMEKQIGRQFTDLEKKQFMFNTKNPRFNEYIVKNKYLNGIQNIQFIDRRGYDGYDGYYYLKGKNIELKYSASTHILPHEIGHYISSDIKYGFVDSKGFATKRVMETYENALKSYASNLTGEKAEKIKGWINNYFDYGKSNDDFLFYQQNQNYRYLIENTGGVVTNYSLHSYSEYISEGFGFYIDNPKALYAKDKGLYNLIDTFFKEGKI